MAMTLRKSRLRLTQAIYYGQPQAAAGAGAVMTNGTTPLTANWNAGNYTINSKNSIRVFNVQAYGAVGNGAANDTQPIADAITAAGSLGTVYFPIGSYLVTSVGTEIFLLTQAVRLVGDYGATILVKTGIGAAVDVFRYSPATANDSFGFRMETLFIIQQTAGEGRHHLVIDATTVPAGSIRQPQIENCNFGEAGGRSIVLQGAPATTSIFLAEIKQNILARGISLVNVGDSLLIAENQLGGTTFAIDGTIVSGANQIVIRDNNITSDGGISITSGVESGPSILYNNIELQLGRTFSGSNNAMVDLTGAATIQNADVVGNNIHILSVGSNVDCLKLGLVNKALIQSNKFIVPAGSKGIVTANTATGILISPSNFFTGAGTYLNLLGTPSIVGNSANGNVGFGTTAAPNTLVSVNVPFVVGASEPLVTAQNGVDTLAGLYGVRDTGGTSQGLEFWTFKANVGQFFAGRIDNAGNFGIATASPTRTLDLNGTQRWRGIAAPAVSEANSGTIYFDSGLNKLRASLNGSAYVDLIGSAGLTGSGVAGKVTYWDGAASVAGAANIYADSVNHRLGIKVATPLYGLDMDGDINITTGSVIRVNSLQVLKSDTATQVVAVGDGTGPALGNNSTAVGHKAINVGTGLGNTAVGRSGLVATTSGARNTGLGDQAGATNSTGDNNLYLGYQADGTAGNLTNAVAIGYQASVAASDTMSLGNASMKVGIHTTTAKTALDVDGAISTRHKNIAVVNDLNSNIALTDTSWVRLTGPTGVFSIGGFTNFADGRVLRIYNTVAFAMTIVNEDGSSTAANRIWTLTGGNVTLRAGTSSCTLVYDDADDRWILLSSN